MSFKKFWILYFYFQSVRGWSSLVWSADFKSVGDEIGSVVRFHLLRVYMRFFHSCLYFDHDFLRVWNKQTRKCQAKKCPLHFKHVVSTVIVGAAWPAKRASASACATSTAQREIDPFVQCDTNVDYRDSSRDCRRCASADGCLARRDQILCCSSFISNTFKRVFLRHQHACSRALSNVRIILVPNIFGTKWFHIFVQNASISYKMTLFGTKWPIFVQNVQKWGIWYKNGSIGSPFCTEWTRSAEFELQWHAKQCKKNTAYSI